MNKATKKIIVCIIVDQLLKRIPGCKTKLAAVLGQDEESLIIELLSQTITTAGVTLVWKAVTSVVDWRILVASSASIVFLYYICNRLQEDTEILTDSQLDNISKKLLN